MLSEKSGLLNSAVLFKTSQIVKQTTALFKNTFFLVFDIKADDL